MSAAVLVQAQCKDLTRRCATLEGRETTLAQQCAAAQGRADAVQQDKAALEQKLAAMSGLLTQRVQTVCKAHEQLTANYPCML